MLGVLLTQPQIGSGGGSKGSEDTTIDLAKDILSKIPNTFNLDEVSEKYPVLYSNSMNTVLKQVRFQMY